MMVVVGGSIFLDARCEHGRWEGGRCLIYYLTTVFKPFLVYELNAYFSYCNIHYTNMENPTCTYDRGYNKPN